MGPTCEEYVVFGSNQSVALRPHMQIVCNLEGLVLWMSPEAAETLGWRMAELLGRPISKIAHRDDAPTLDELLDAARQPYISLRPDGASAVRLRTKFGNYETGSVVATGILGLTQRLLGVVFSFEFDSVTDAESERAPLDDELDALVTLDAVRDADGHVVDFEYVEANLAACAYLHVPLAKLIGSRLMERFPGVDPIGLFSLCTLVFETGNPACLWEHDVVQGDFAGRYDFSAVATPTGVTLGWRDAIPLTVTPGIDLQAELALMPADQSPFAMTSDAIAFGSTDGFLEWVSDGITELTGWMPQELAGQRFRDLICPLDAAEVYATQQAVLAGQQGTFEARFQTRSGDYRWLTFSARPLITADGTVVGRIATIRDATSDPVALTALAASTARVEAAMQASAVGMCLVSPEGRFLEVNPALCSLLHTSTATLLNKNWTDIVHPDDLHLDDDVVASLRSGERDAYRSTVRLVAATGGTIWAELAVGAVRDQHSRIRYYVTQVVDVTARIESSEALEQSERMLRLMLDSSPDAIVQYDRQLRVEYANPKAQVLSDRPIRTWSGCTNSEFGLHPSLAHRWDDHLRRVFVTGRSSRFEDVVGAASDARWFDIWLTPDTDAAGTVRHVVLAARDVTGAKATEARLLQAATHDALTGLANRAALLEELHRALAAASRSHLGVAALIIDLDHFKNINDSLGHLSGDVLLIEAAERILGAARESDLVARLGGDEFVIAMRDATDHEGACAIGQRVVEAFRAPFDVGGVEVYATASVGIAVSGDDTTSEDLLREADTALYLAKANGRNRFAVYNEELRGDVTERVRLESDLRTAVAHHGLSVWFQPEVELATGEAIGAEALLRWERPNGTVEDAARFIHVAEETGLIVEVGAWVMREACRFAVEMNHERATPFVVRVNVSALELVNLDFLDQLDAALAATGVDPRWLSLEITETVLLGATPVVHMNLDGVHGRGIGIAIDDFGTGYGSLTYLRQYPISAIKLDRTFISGVVDEPRDRSLVRALVTLAKEFSLDVVAEGVETTAQQHRLLELGCTRAQGYLYSRALPAAELLAGDGVGPA